MLGILKDKKDSNIESYSLTRTVAIATWIVLSAGFILNAKNKALSELVYIAYPLGVAVAFAPQLFLRLLNGIKEVIAAWKSGGQM